WTAPQDTGGGAAAQCEIRVSSLPIATTDAWNALPAGTIIPGAPPGTQQSTVVAPLKTGRPLIFGLRCFAGAGNGSDVGQKLTPITLAFTSSATLAAAAVTGYDVTLGGFGTSATGADLN